MDKPITVSFRWSAEEFLRAKRLDALYSKEQRKFQRVMLRGGLFSLIVGIVFLVIGHALRPVGVPLVLFGVVVFLTSSPDDRTIFLKLYAQQPDHNRVVTCEISSDRIACQSEVTSVAFVWRTIRANRTPEGFLLYPADREMLWLPVHGFQDSADIERLAQIAKLHGKEYNDATETSSTEHRYAKTGPKD